MQQLPPMTQSQEITDDDLYRHTSQYRLWSFTQQQLQTIREHTHAEAQALLHQRLVSVSIDRGTPMTDEQATEMIPTFEETQTLTLSYAAKVATICSIFGMPSSVKATAVTFFQRFYLRTSVLTQHPKNVMYTCVFLASKAENYFVPIDQFVSKLPKLEPHDVLSIEFQVLQGIGFSLLVQNPVRPLHGFFLDLQAECPRSKDQLGRVVARARTLLLDHLLSDACFLFTPPQVALTALYLADREVTQEYLSRKGMWSQMLPTIEACSTVVTGYEIASTEREREIDKKLYRVLKYEKSKKRAATNTPPDQNKRVKTEDEK